MARLFGRLSDYNSILLLVDAAMLPYEAGERKREYRVLGLLPSRFRRRDAMFHISHMKYGISLLA